MTDKETKQKPIAWVNKDGWFRKAEDADAAFRAYAYPLYAGPTKKEWVKFTDEERKPVMKFKVTVIDDEHPNGIPLEQWGNAAPPKREWVGLTDDELPEGATYEFDRGVRWAEAKLKEKNNG